MSESVDNHGDDNSKETFISREDRPEVRLNPDTPLTELRVRDLSAILGSTTSKNPNFEVGKTVTKDFFDKPAPDVVKGIWQEKDPKREKIEKFEKNEKLEKNEKNEKNEVKEQLKNEKAEQEGPVLDQDRTAVGPGIDQVVELIAGLKDQVRRLAEQVDRLQEPRDQ